MTGTGADPVVLARIRDEIRGHRRFVLSSHLRPDGDAIGSELALADALSALGKQVVIVNCDPAPPAVAWLPGVERIRLAAAVDEPFDVAIILECGELSRTGVSGLDRGLVINVDHHPGNTLYGDVNWHDGAAAACGEMVLDVIDALGVPLTATMATAIYVAIVTDTGSFHFSGVSPKTFDICRRTLEAGADPVNVARRVYDSNTVPRLRLWSAVLGTLDVEGSGRVAVIRLDREMAARAGASFDDTEGLINVPLTVPEIVAVAFFKEAEGGRLRVSLRSKGDIDVNAVAASFGGGGHKNASGCTVDGPVEAIRPALMARLTAALAAAGQTTSP